MPRRAVFLVLGLAGAVGVVVALVQVHAQESSRRGNGQTSPESAPTGATRVGLSDTSAVSGDASSSTTVIRPSGSLTERLRAIRSGTSGQGDSPAAPVSPASPATPIAADAYQPQPSPANSLLRESATGDTGLRPTTPFTQPPAGGEAWNPGAATGPQQISPAPINRWQLPDRTSNQGGYAPSADGGAFPMPASPPREIEPFPQDPQEAARNEGEGELQSVLKRPPPTAQSAVPAADALRVARDPREETSSSRRGAPSYEPSPSDAAAAPWQSNSAPAQFPEASLSRSADKLALSSVGPALRVETSGPRSVALGQEAIFQISVVSLSDAEAPDVVVAVDLPDWVQIVGGDTSTGRTEREGDNGASGRLIWSVGSVAARSQEQLRLKVVPRASQPFELGVNWGFSPAPTVAQVEVQEPQLQVSLLGPDDVRYGQPAVYTIVLTNPGTGDAQHVAVGLAPLVPGGAAGGLQQVGTLAAGQKKEIQIEVTPRQAGTINLQVNATADGDLQSEAARQVRVRRAELQIAATGPELKYAGTVASYQVSIVNTGDADAENVQVDLLLPTGAKYVAGIDQAQSSARGLRWTAGRLPAGSQRNYDVQCELTVAGNVKLDVTARADGDLSSSASVVTRVDSIAELQLVVNDPQGPRPVGADAVYEIRVSNRGTKEARGVSVVVQFSQGVEPASADGQASEIVPGQVVFAPIDRLDPGQEKTLKVIARAEQAGNHVFRAEVRCADPETRRVSEGTTRFFESSGAGGARSER